MSKYHFDSSKYFHSMFREGYNNTNGKVPVSHKHTPLFQLIANNTLKSVLIM
jgi:hypothetical protein